MRDENQTARAQGEGNKVTRRKRHRAKNRSQKAGGTVPRGQVLGQHHARCLAEYSYVDLDRPRSMGLHQNRSGTDHSSGAFRVDLGAGRAAAKALPQRGEFFGPQNAAGPALTCVYYVAVRHKPVLRPFLRSLPMSSSQLVGNSVAFAVHGRGTVLPAGLGSARAVPARRG